MNFDELELGSNSPSPLRLAAAAGWAAVVATAGGFGCGLLIDRYGEVASISLWFLGAVGGYVGYKIVGAPQPLVGWLLVASGLAALVIAEVCWIHWNLVGADSWWTAFTLLPKFVQEYELSAIIAALFTGFGCWSAYHRMARGFAG